MKVLQVLVGQMAVYAYVVGCEKTGQALAIDPAGQEEQVVAEAGRQGLTIVGIVNTHGHPDHTCGGSKIKELTGAPIIIHEADAGPMVSPHAQQFAQMLGCAGTPPADRTVTHGERLTAGEEVSLEVLHTPGHSPGSMCLYTPGHVFTGGTLFVGGWGAPTCPAGPGARCSRPSRSASSPCPTRPSSGRATTTLQLHGEGRARGQPLPALGGRTMAGVKRP